MRCDDLPIFILPPSSFCLSLLFDEECLQPAECSRDHHPHRSVGFTELFGDFFGREADEVAEAEGFALVVGQGFERGHCAELTLVARKGLAGGGHASGEQVGESGGFAAGGESGFARGVALLAGEMSAVGVDDFSLAKLKHPVQRIPARQIGLSQDAHGLHTGILQDVLGLDLSLQLRANAATNEGEQRLLVGLQKSHERSFVARS